MNTVPTGFGVTELAQSKLKEYLGEEPENTFVRIFLEQGKYQLSLDEKRDEDAQFEFASLPFVVEQEFLETLEALTIDYLEQGAASGFSLKGGKAPSQARVVLRSEDTPNPDARKFVLSFSLGGKSKTWKQGEEHENAPAAIQEVLALDGVESVFQLNNFITVTRTSGKEWSELAPTATKILNTLERPSLGHDHQVGDGSGSFEDQLAQFIVTDVAPFLQQDGGDIELVGYDNGKVMVRLVGACGTCPSSIMTLRGGVERSLKQRFPDEVKELELVNPMAAPH